MSGQGAGGEPGQAIDHAMERTLNRGEMGRLEKCEARIAEAVAEGERITGEALAEIRDDRLYRADHPSFEDYCLRRWGFSLSTAKRMIVVAEEAKALVSGDRARPISQRKALKQRAERKALEAGTQEPHIEGQGDDAADGTGHDRTAGVHPEPEEEHAPDHSRAESAEEPSPHVEEGSTGGASAVDAPLAGPSSVRQEPPEPMREAHPPAPGAHAGRSGGSGGNGSVHRADGHGPSLFPEAVPLLSLDPHETAQTRSLADVRKTVAEVEAWLIPLRGRLKHEEPKSAERSDDVATFFKGGKR